MPGICHLLCSSRSVAICCFDVPLHVLDPQFCLDGTKINIIYNIGDQEFAETSYQIFNNMFEAKTNDASDDTDSAPAQDSSPTDDKLECSSDKELQGSIDRLLSLEALNSAAEEFCEQRVNEKTKWTPKETADPANDGTSITKYFTRDDRDGVVVSIRWLYGNMDCSALDFGSPDAMQLCKDRFGTIINNCKSCRWNLWRRPSWTCAD